MLPSALRDTEIHMCESLQPGRRALRERWFDLCHREARRFRSCWCSMSPSVSGVLTRTTLFLMTVTSSRVLDLSGLPAVNGTISVKIITVLTRYRPIVLELI